MEGEDRSWEKTPQSKLRYYIEEGLGDIFAWYHVKLLWCLSFKVVSFKVMNLHIFMRNGMKYNHTNVKASHPIATATIAIATVATASSSSSKIKEVIEISDKDEGEENELDSEDSSNSEEADPGN